MTPELVLEMLNKQVQERVPVSHAASFFLLCKEKAKMNNFLIRLWNDEQGQDLTEYALLLVLLTLAAIGSLSTLATAVNGVFAKAASNLSTT
jgi:Flp pilus assembly pilin Flp